MRGRVERPRDSNLSANTLACLPTARPDRSGTTMDEGLHMRRENHRVEEDHQTKTGIEEGELATPRACLGRCVDAGSFAGSLQEVGNVAD